MDRRLVAITKATDELIRAFGGVKAAIRTDDPELVTLHRQGDYPGMVRQIRNSMKMSLNIRLGIVRRDDEGPDAPAWINVPSKMPMYGTQDFNRARITIYIRRSFLIDAPFQTIVMAISHELSHIV